MIFFKKDYMPKYRIGMYSKSIIYENIRGMCNKKKAKIFANNMAIYLSTTS